MRPPKFCRNRSNGRRVMAFPIFSNMAASAILNLKSFSIWSYDCHCVPNLLLYTKFHQNWVTRSASIGRRRGNSIMPDMSGTHTMGCDHPSFIQIGPLAGNLSHFQYFPTRQPFAIFNLKKNNIWSHGCDCVPNLLSCTNFYQNWFTRSASRRP